MSEMMTFPDTVDEFMEQYKITDTEQVYTNGCELVPIFRMKQWFESHPEPHWIPVTERLPEEEDSIFARYYGTDRWSKSMFRKKSREVIVTSVFKDGELHTEVAHTTDGEWHVGVNVVPRTVIAWMPLPEPFKGVTE